jgi:hypothetical protein
MYGLLTPKHPGFIARYVYVQVDGLIFIVQDVSNETS